MIRRGSVNTGFGNGAGAITLATSDRESFDDLTKNSASRLLVLGQEWSAGTPTYLATKTMVIWRYSTDGVYDPNFSKGNGIARTGLVENQTVSQIIADNLGRILILGDIQNGATSADTELAAWRFTAEGVLDNSFASNGVYRYIQASYNTNTEVALALDSESGINLLARINNGLSSEMLLMRLDENGAVYADFGDIKIYTPRQREYHKQFPGQPQTIIE